MSASYVQLAPDQSGKKIRMFENAIAGNTVEAMAVVAVSAGVLPASFVEVAPDSTGKKIQYFKNTIAGNEVHAQALVLVNSSGAGI